MLTRSLLSHDFDQIKLDFWKSPETKWTKWICKAHSFEFVQRPLNSERTTELRERVQACPYNSHAFAPAFEISTQSRCMCYTRRYICFESSWVDLSIFQIFICFLTTSSRFHRNARREWSSRPYYDSRSFNQNLKNKMKILGFIILVYKVRLSYRTQLNWTLSVSQDRNLKWTNERTNCCSHEKRKKERV